MKKFVIGIGEINTQADAKPVFTAIEAIKATVKNVEMFDFEVMVMMTASELSERGYEIVKTSIAALQDLGLIVHTVVTSESMEPEVLASVAKSDILAIGSQAEVTAQSEIEMLNKEHDSFMDALTYQTGFTIWGDILEDVINQHLLEPGQKLVMSPAITQYVSAKLSMHDNLSMFNTENSVGELKKVPEDNMGMSDLVAENDYLPDGFMISATA